jgi:hypothetical protein
MEQGQQENGGLMDTDTTVITEDVVVVKYRGIGVTSFLMRMFTKASRDITVPAFCQSGKTVLSREQRIWKAQWILREGPRMKLVPKFPILRAETRFNRRTLRCNRKGIGLRLRK